MTSSLLEIVGNIVGLTSMQFFISETYCNHGSIFKITFPSTSPISLTRKEYESDSQKEKYDFVKQRIQAKNFEEHWEIQESISMKTKLAQPFIQESLIEAKQYQPQS